MIPGLSCLWDGRQAKRGFATLGGVRSCHWCFGGCLGPEPGALVEGTGLPVLSKNKDLSWLTYPKPQIDFPESFPSGG